LTRQATNDDPLAGFGPNEWIVEDMYQRYLADPASVDPAWHDFFADYRPQATDSGDGGPAPEPAASGLTTAATKERSEEGRRGPEAPGPARAEPGTAPGPARAERAQPGTAPAPARAERAQSGTARTAPIRGVAARIAQNMEASLHVPTATSVRSVPAKLLADNRIVVNNHLARGRGGKVSFTHLIGYALVKALAVHPEMNNSYAVEGGKPTLVTPEHVNLGIAIDLVKADGSRTLVVPSIKGADLMDFRHFWQSYEDIVRRARRTMSS